MSRAWYYAESNQQRGPVDEAGVQELLSTGRMRGTDLVWSEGMPEWQPAATVPQFTPWATMLAAGGAQASAARASFWRRAVAWVVDFVVVFLFIVLPVGFAVIATSDVTIQDLEQGQDGRLNAAGRRYQLVSSFISLLLVWLYHTLMVGLFGTTAGKALVGVRVMTADGDETSYARAAVRALAALAPTVPFVLSVIQPEQAELRLTLAALVLVALVYALADHVSQPFNEDRQTLHDRAAGTVVVNDRA